MLYSKEFSITIGIRDSVVNSQSNVNSVVKSGLTVQGLVRTG